MSSASQPRAAGGADFEPIRREIELIRMTALRSLKVRYRGTALGVLWSFANPILMTALYTAIFGSAFKTFYGGSLLAYSASAFVGVVVLTFFLQATAESLLSVVSNASLLNKIAVPREVFPLATIASNAFQQCVTTFPALLLISIVLGHDPLRIVLLPFVLASVLAVSAGFGLALAALFVFFRDLPHLWTIVGFVLWLTSPVFYPAELVPANVRPWLSVNPIGYVMTATRDLVLPVHGPLHVATVLGSLFVGAFSLIAGWMLFRLTAPDFMDLL